MKNLRVTAVAAILLTITIPSQAFAATNSNNSGMLDILKQGLLGAGTGAISAEVSGGKAGKGALIGAGTNIIGGVLLSFLTGSSNQNQQPAYVSQPYYSEPQPQLYTQPVYQQQSVYQQPAYQYQQPVYQQPVYYSQEPVYVQPAPSYYRYNQPQTQTNTNKYIIRQGILGAGTGAIAAGASGGKAGQGALVGAGTNVIGGALLELLAG